MAPKEGVAPPCLPTIMAGPQHGGPTTDQVETWFPVYKSCREIGKVRDSNHSQKESNYPSCPLARIGAGGLTVGSHPSARRTFSMMSPLCRPMPFPFAERRTLMIREGNARSGERKMLDLRFMQVFVSSKLFGYCHQKRFAKMPEDVACTLRVALYYAHKRNSGPHVMDSHWRAAAQETTLTNNYGGPPARRADH